MTESRSGLDVVSLRLSRLWRKASKVCWISDNWSSGESSTDSSVLPYRWVMSLPDNGRCTEDDTVSALLEKMLNIKTFLESSNTSTILDLTR